MKPEDKERLRLHAEHQIKDFTNNLRIIEEHQAILDLIKENEELVELTKSFIKEVEKQGFVINTEFECKLSDIYFTAKDIIKETE